MSDDHIFTAAYDQYSDAIFRHCYFRVFDRERALELMQETFTRTWSYLAKGQEVKNLRAFLYRVANNLIIDEARKRRTVSLDELRERNAEPLPPKPEPAYASHDYERARNAMRQLDDKLRQAVMLRYLDGFSPREIANLTGAPVTTIYVRLHRGLKLLREKLQHA